MWGKKIKAKKTRVWGFKSTMKKVSSQGAALDDQSFAVTNRGKLGGDYNAGQIAEASTS